MNPWTSVTSLALLEDDLDFLKQKLVTRLTLTWLAGCAIDKSVKTTSGCLEQTTHQSNGELTLVIDDKLILHGICLAKRSL
jgi:hypothetical protein